MRQQLYEKELAVLECLKSSGIPLGSWNLVEKLEERGMSVSSATIGRILNTLERMGLVKKNGHSGRIITPAGVEALSNAKVIDNIKQHTEKLEQLVTTTVLEDYILVLEARKAIEREAARLAAENITETELQALEEILAEQSKRHSNNESIAANDIAFHRAIAHASRNKVLEALYMMLFSYGQQTSIFEFIRRQVNAVYMRSHLDIFEALKAHDPDRTEQCMIHHIDSLMEDVSMYWDEFSDQE
ncbi:MAG: FCD domain-containing protein [Bacillota bacterium]